MTGDEYGDLQWKGASVGPAEPAEDVAQFTMSLRDWFAGQALAGMCANSAWDGVSWASTTLAAYDAADAMLAERAKSRS